MNIRTCLVIMRSASRPAAALVVTSLLLAVSSGFIAQAGQTPPPGGPAELRCIPLEQALNPPPSIPTSQDARHIRRVGARESSLSYSAAVGDDVIEAGKEVDFSLTVKNTGGSAVVLSFPTTQRFDVVIWDDDCHEVWRWSRGRVFAQVFTSLSLPAAGSSVFHVLWNQHDQTGQPVRIAAYEARVVFLGRWANRSTPFVFPPLIFAVR